MKGNRLKILIILFDFYIINGYDYEYVYQPAIQPRIGGIWPKPSFERRCVNHLIDPINFEFVIVEKTCDILDQAIIRYTKIIKELVRNPVFDTEEDVIENSFISKVAVNLTNFCEHLPYLKMDESYKISGPDNIIAHSIWGMLRALETYSQTITPTLMGMLQISNMRIVDAPRFPHRGLMIDTARHFINITTIFTILDGMAYNKLNVFHWHIVDDESFPYQSIKFPELSEKGAYKPSMIYTQENISNIIEYARMRGIRVVAEFDVPGHTRSWGNSHRELLTICEWFSTGKIGPIDPIRKRTYRFLQNFFNEILQVFPDKYIHLGGDEVDFDCWENNEAISNYISSNGLTVQYLYKFFINTIAKLFTKKSITPIFWQEAMTNNYEMPNETIIQVQLKDWKDNVNRFTKAGYHVILSECWALNKFANASKNNWINDYNCEPLDFGGTNEQKELVLGGEAFIWTDVIGNDNIIQKIFPRISAAAERLWSREILTNISDAEQRLEEHTCRMKLRGMQIESPSGSVFCR